ncbi:MAG: response regulator, partial [Planctomycetes bacterium]|nr:response regulator [Planctomycetota bacterium]
MTIRVLVVDDSAVVRGMLSREIPADGDIQVVDTAPDSFVARDKIVKLKPDVVTLDLQMPKMDGITFLKKLMHYFPIPVIVLSSFTEKGSELALEALDAGAVEVMSKPSKGLSVQDWALTLREKIRGAARVRAGKKQEVKARPTQKLTVSRDDNKLIAIGASTGGTSALNTVLSVMPESSPGIVVVQHMPENFTKSFAERLNRHSMIEVREAQDGDEIHPGLA